MLFLSFHRKITIAPALMKAAINEKWSCYSTFSANKCSPALNWNYFTNDIGIWDVRYTAPA